ncbi:hypothetical protein PN36_21685 [Candidatus Thiomargarita nelsonii]|uniref:DUF2085 domain-containing protein n=1 Tax=Candidatus Thiomargarita nelsonii TaxID=1003181 RepID=A0A4E0QZX0_9GAMM|nr:hypothetical protein PN36_21685 [Candidatus Thiomargarita nelsonii]
MLKKVVEELIHRLSKIGKLPVCNLRGDRAPHICGICFPLCWRCTSIIASFLLSHHILVLWIEINSVIALLLCVPTVIDGTLQYYFYIESTNFRRIWTGILAGVGIAFLT